MGYSCPAMSRLTPAPKPNLMIIDDDPDQLGLFRITAERTCLYWRIATAEDGDMALRQITAWSEELPRFVPQIVLSDIKMPRMGGIEFARTLRHHPQLPPIHTVAMSSSSYPPEVQAALEAGCVAFFQKPGDFAKLTELFRKLPGVCGLGPDGDRHHSFLVDSFAEA